MGPRLSSQDVAMLSRNIRSVVRLSKQVQLRDQALRAFSCSAVFGHVHCIKSSTMGTQINIVTARPIRRVGSTRMFSVVKIIILISYNWYLILLNVKLR